MSSARWLNLKDRLDEAYYLHPPKATIGILWALVAIFPIAFFLNLVAAFKRAQLGSFWLIRVDSEGYLQENRNVIVPVLSAVKTMAAFTCIVSLLHDFRTHFHSTTMILQVLAFVGMHTLNWMRTWGSIYSMPPESFFDFNQNRTKSPFATNSRKIKPWLYNSFMVAGLLYGVVLGTVGLAKMCPLINRVNQLYHSLSETLDQNIALSGNPTSESLSLLKLNTAILHEGMQEMQSQSSALFGILDALILCFLAINFLSVILFWWSLYTIIGCLNSRLEAYHRSLRNRSEAFQLGMISEFQAMSNIHDASHSSDGMENLSALGDRNRGCNSRSPTESINGNWRMWLPTLQRNTVVADHFLWKSPLMHKVAQNGPNQKASLRHQYVLLRRYKINTLWQAIFITIMAFNYEAMGITLKINPFDVPTRTTTAELAVILIVWSNTIWAIGGTVMALLSALVAYSGNSTVEQKNVVEVQLEDAKSFDY